MMRLRSALMISILAFIGVVAANDALTYGQSVNPAIVQERLNSHIIDEDRTNRRFEQFQDVYTAQSIATEKRLATLETIAETNIWWLRAIGSGLVVLVIERFLFRKQR